MDPLLWVGVRPPHLLLGPPHLSLLCLSLQPWQMAPSQYCRSFVSDQCLGPSVRSVFSTTPITSSSRAFTETNLDYTHLCPHIHDFTLCNFHTLTQAHKESLLQSSWTLVGFSIMAVGEKMTGCLMSWGSSSKASPTTFMSTLKPQKLNSIPVPTVYSLSCRSGQIALFFLALRACLCNYNTQLQTMWGFSGAVGREGQQRDSAWQLWPQARDYSHQQTWNRFLTKVFYHTSHHSHLHRWESKIDTSASLSWGTISGNSSFYYFVSIINTFLKGW